MVSYWKLIDMTNADVIGVGNEKRLYELKMLYENKLNTPTKMIKCFGQENYEKDWKNVKIKSLELLNEHKY
jgi:hypothetical protein